MANPKGIAGTVTQITVGTDGATAILDSGDRCYLSLETPNYASFFAVLTGSGTGKKKVEVSGETASDGKTVVVKDIVLTF